MKTRDLQDGQAANEQKNPPLMDAKKDAMNSAIAQEMNTVINNKA